MVEKFRPMLAPGNDPNKDPYYFDKLQFPLLASPKLDGIRCIVKQDRIEEYDGDFNLTNYGDVRYVCKSREFIDLPSRQVQEHFSLFAELDGEIIVGEETDHDVYNRTQSYVMSQGKLAADLKFRVFDCADMSIAHEEFEMRLEHARKLIRKYSESFVNLIGAQVSLVEHQWVDSVEELIEYEALQLALGYEGVMMRSPFGRYKHGRGTFNEGLIYKLKRFQDDEAIVLGFEEQQTNTNTDVRDNLGHAKRSTAKEGMVAAGTMGKIVVEYNGMILEVAPGVMKHYERKFVWDNQDYYKGKIIKFRHFPHGVKDKPRFPRFVGWRDKMDIGAKAPTNATGLSGHEAMGGH